MIEATIRVFIMTWNKCWRDGEIFKNIKINPRVKLRLKNNFQKFVKLDSKLGLDIISG